MMKDRSLMNISKVKEHSNAKMVPYLPSVLCYWAAVLLIFAVIMVVILVRPDTTTTIFGHNLYYASIYVGLPASLFLMLLCIALWAFFVRGNYRSWEEIEKDIETLELREQRDQDTILRLMDELAELSNGDLTVEAQVTEDFTGAIADSVNFAIESMRDLVGSINLTANEVSGASERTKILSKEMTGSALAQMEELKELSEILREMVQSLDRTALSTTDSAVIARESVTIARNGSAKVQDTIDGMNKIREHIQDTSKRIKRLGESSQEIGNIVEIIKGISDQTSILALNAAIQASSAGATGKGFAVVADEVQKLAERSAGATRRIESLVKTIQGDTNEAIFSMEKSTKEVVNGAGIAEEAGAALSQIEEVSTSLASLIDRVSLSTRRVSTRAKDLERGMQGINDIVKATTENVHKTTGAIDHLDRLSQELQGSVSHFTLPKNS
ncbi:methyl-accepting chemotaxis protein [Suttonella sp. R2A3]|uniref:methyl-accepting chemotaxis protein n=1 Tax=Suttonella sp. R2A3 TaxID=2908648 RepID=UPI001F2DCD32|nr:methyl-accepting chemotaxis protein [Suttonella sp. R2A3]UJF25296.1 methyl-accepting chemotaxis protein [Suttonella sp. R2A3]